MQDREIWLFLQMIPGIGRRTLQKLWEHFQSAQAIYTAAEADLKKQLRPLQLQAFLKARAEQSPKEAAARLVKLGISYCSVFDPEYPKRLWDIPDRPFGLFVKGHLPPEDTLAVSVVGTRRHSYYGEKYTRSYSERIAQQGIVLVSGMASGIDGIAHRTALQHGGRTYAVLGCGVDICYPKEHERLYEAIWQQGGILSEYPPGTPPAAGLFPQRNRIISGLCDVLLVMEAREKSGTLITVDMALEQGREIFALPGRVDDVMSVGCNRLIAQGAGILPPLPEFEQELRLWKERYPMPQQRKTNALPCQTVRFERAAQQREVVLLSEEKKEPLSELERRILSVLDYQPLTLEHIYQKLRKTTGEEASACQVSAALINLCIKGAVCQLQGDCYIKR